MNLLELLTMAENERDLKLETSYFHGEKIIALLNSHGYWCEALL